MPPWTQRTPRSPSWSTPSTRSVAWTTGSVRDPSWGTRLHASQRADGFWVFLSTGGDRARFVDSGHGYLTLITGATAGKSLRLVNGSMLVVN